METAPTTDNRADAVPSAACLPDAFYRHILAYNPFILNRASADGGEGPDVVQIHSDVLGRLTELAGEAVRLRRGLGVLLAGEAGCGKSHVLGRLARWAAVGGRACFAVVRGLQTDPELLPAAVMRSAGAALTGRQGAAPARTPLYRMVHAAARSAMTDEQDRYAWDRVGRAFARLADRLAPAARRLPEGRATFDLIFRFFRSAARTAEGKEDGTVAETILRWFTGGMLDAGEARRLHLPPARHRDDPVTLTDPEWARQGLTALAVMASAAGRPFVLVFDQIEELDSGRFAALARFLNGLLDHAPGVLAVTAADTAAVVRWKDRGDVSTAAWDRLAQFTIEPSRLRPAEGMALVRRRLDDALNPFKEVEFLYRLRADAPLFPLHFELNGCGVWARGAIEAARLAWDAEQVVLKREGGAAWLAGWAERVVAARETSEATESEPESSLTREQVQAAIAVRSKPQAAPQEPPEAVDSPVLEEIPSLAEANRSLEAELLPEVSTSSFTQEQAQTASSTPPEPELEAPITLTPGEVANGEASLSDNQLLAAAACHAVRSEGVEPPPTDEVGPETTAEMTEQSEPPHEEVPSAPASVEETLAQADVEEPTPASELAPSEPVPDEPTRFSDYESPGECVSSDAESAFAEAPTVPDPNGGRLRRIPDAPTATALADPEPLVFAPSGNRAILTPRAWPPTASAPSPREEMIDHAVSGMVSDYLNARGPGHELPADAEQVAELILNLLQQCCAADAGYGILQAERVPPWKATPPACDLVVRQQADGEAVLRTGILVLTASRATAIAGYLRRLATESQPFDRLFLITEERVGLPLGPRGLEYLQELEQRSSVHLHTLELTTTEHAELSALRAAVRQARGSTVAAEGVRITEAEVIASHHRQQRYLASRFLSAILFDAPPTELLRKLTAMTQ